VSAWHERDDCYINLIFLLHICSIFVGLLFVLTGLRGGRKCAKHLYYNMPQVPMTFSTTRPLDGVH
jgi:hypothetical protein